MVQGLEYALEVTEAKEGVIALKAKYKKRPSPRWKSHCGEKIIFEFIFLMIAIPPVMSTLPFMKVLGVSFLRGNSLKSRRCSNQCGNID